MKLSAPDKVTLVGVAITLIIAAVVYFVGVGTANAGPLDILDANGEFDSRVGQEHFSADNTTVNNITMNVQQGVRFRGAPWIEPYMGFNKAQALYVVGGNTESLYGGVRNKTFLPPFAFGLEYRSTIVPDDPSIKSVVGYISVYKDWNLLKGDKE